MTPNGSGTRDCFHWNKCSRGALHVVGFCRTFAASVFWRTTSRSRTRATKQKDCVNYFVWNMRLREWSPIAEWAGTCNSVSRKTHDVANGCAAACCAHMHHRHRGQHQRSSKCSLLQQVVGLTADLQVLQGKATAVAGEYFHLGKPATAGRQRHFHGVGQVIPGDGQ